MKKGTLAVFGVIVIAIVIVGYSAMFTIHQT